MGHSYNFGTVTSSRGLAIEYATVNALTVANGALCTIKEDCKAGLIRSVTHTAAGVYTVQFEAPWPPKLVYCEAKLNKGAVGDPVRTAGYRANSYNATTGQLIVDVADGTPAAADPAATAELHLHLAFNRYTN